MLSARARDAAAQHGPVIRDRVLDAGGRATASAMVVGERVIRDGRAGLAERRAQGWFDAAFLRRRATPVGLGAAAVLVGALLYGKHQAGVVAGERVDLALRQSGLGTIMTHGPVSASLFGVATIPDVSLVLPDGVVRIAALRVSDVAGAGTIPSSLRLVATGVSLPTPILEGMDAPPEFTRTVAGLSYLPISGDAELGWKFDDPSRVFTLDGSASVPRLGTTRLHLRLGGITSAQVNGLAATANAMASGLNSFANASAAFAAAQTLYGLTLTSARLSFTDDGVLARCRDIPADELPAPTERPSAPSETFVAGLPPALQSQASEAVSSWLRNGGTLVLATQERTETPLFHAGPFGAPSFAYDNPLSLLSAAGVTLTRE